MFGILIITGRKINILGLTESEESSISWYFLQLWAFKISCSAELNMKELYLGASSRRNSKAMKLFWTKAKVANEEKFKDWQKADKQCDNNNKPQGKHCLRRPAASTSLVKAKRNVQ